MFRPGDQKIGPKSCSQKKAFTSLGPDFIRLKVVFFEKKVFTSLGPDFFRSKVCSLKKKGLQLQTCRPIIYYHINIFCVKTIWDK